ncbi:MAG: low temperature requirement protein A [Saprospiraceae bacterium]|nr:low temperature requirement protein A [Saprospiraceae bacterium]
MKINVRSNTWWGPPKKFSAENEERKVSWLELFYDLVYVLAIAKITHHLAEHLSLSSLSQFFFFFTLIFWGWLNGSLYHDLHGSSGLRTRLMTLWQMLIVAALVITLDSPEEQLVFNVTIVLLVMQLYITYLWWSVGFYDRSHRRLNRPYTILFLASFGLMFSTFYLEQPYIQIAFYSALLLNYLPPFITHFLLRRDSMALRLSASMSERLGLFTIIVFGEVIAGIINGVGALPDLNIQSWVNFTLAVIIVFALWWLFFTLVSDRTCKPGFLNSSLLEMLYIPTLIALGLIGMSFSGIFENYDHHDAHFISQKEIFGYALCLFLLGINFMMYFLEYPPQYVRLRNRAQLIIYAAIGLILIVTLLDLNVSLFYYLLIILSFILGIIALLNYNWYAIFSEGQQKQADV